MAVSHVYVTHLQRKTPDTTAAWASFSGAAPRVGCHTLLGELSTVRVTPVGEDNGELPPVLPCTLPLCLLPLLLLICIFS